jgi:hypothetical protein
MCPSQGSREEGWAIFKTGFWTFYDIPLREHSLTQTNDVCKPLIADDMFVPLRRFEATGWPYWQWYSPVGAVLHRNEWNTIVFQLNVVQPTTTTKNT